MQELINLCFKPVFPYVTLDENKDIELSMGIRDGTLYLAFLGSITVKDWLHNFKFWKKPYKHMKNAFFVHAGFLSIYKVCREPIHQFIAAHKAEFSSIHISGHSLGAAVATLCYEDVQYLKETGIIDVAITGLVTGSPRVFGVINSKVAQRRCASLIRLVNGRDIVPHLPPAIMGYRHCGNPLPKGHTLPLPIPSIVYKHDTESYKHFLDNSWVDTANNNYTYANAITAFDLIYAGLAIIAMTILALIL